MSELLLAPEEAFRRIGVGRAMGFKLLKSGQLPSIKIGKLRRIPTSLLEEFVQKQIALQVKAENKEDRLDEGHPWDRNR